MHYIAKTYFCAASLLLGIAAPTYSDNTMTAPSATGRSKGQADQVLVKFRRNASAGDRAAIHRKHGFRVARSISALNVEVVSVPPGKTSDFVQERYANHPLVEYAEPDLPCEPAFIPNDEFYSFQWHLSDIGAPQAWDTTVGSNNVVIAVLDTGINQNLSELVGRVVPGWNVYDGNNDTTDVIGHGSRVAGTIGAMGNNEDLVASVAWGCSLMPVRVSNPIGSSSSSLIAEGLVWAADHGALVANVSFEVSDSSTVSAAAQYFQANGGVVVVGAGNSGIFEPASDDPFMIRVSAYDQSRVVPTWSNIGNNIDLCAPGTSIITLDANGGMSSASGTSHSAPIVAGVAALVLSANGALTGNEVQDILFQTAQDGGPSGWDSSYGWGRVDAAAAVNAAAGGGSTDTSPPTATITDPIAGAEVSDMLRVLVVAADNVAVIRVDLYLDGAFVSSDDVTPHEWTIDTTTLLDGTHTLSAMAYDAAGNEGASSSVDITVSNSCECPADCSEPATNETPGSTCADGLDNDCDGATDCDDADCLGAPGCPECFSDTDCDDGDACTVDSCDVTQTCLTEPVSCPPDHECLGGTCEPILCNPNGVCELEEDCDNCPVDCFSDPGAVCGDGVCDTAGGEDCVSCPSDCNGVQNGSPSQRFCCGDGDGAGPVGCGDSRCSTGGFTCSSASNPGTCCGDLVCEGTETAGNCDVDCNVATFCGDGTCGADENACNCPVDCGDPPLSEQIKSTCDDGIDNDCDGVTDCSDSDCAGAPQCQTCDNDGLCEAGEDSRNCPKDCGGNGRRRSKRR